MSDRQGAGDPAKVGHLHPTHGSVFRALMVVTYGWQLMTP